MKNLSYIVLLFVWGLTSCRQGQRYEYVPVEVDTANFEYIEHKEEEVEEEWEKDIIVEIPEYKDPDLTGPDTHILEDFMNGKDVGAE